MPKLLEGVKAITLKKVEALLASTAIMADWGTELIRVESFRVVGRES